MLPQKIYNKNKNKFKNSKPKQNHELQRKFNEGWLRQIKVLKVGFTVTESWALIPCGFETDEEDDEEANIDSDDDLESISAHGGKIIIIYNKQKVKKYTFLSF